MQPQTYTWTDFTSKRIIKRTKPASAIRKTKDPRKSWIWDEIEAEILVKTGNGAIE